MNTTRTESRIKNTAAAIAYGATADEVGETLMLEGLTSDEARLVYVAAQLLGRDAQAKRPLDTMPDYWTMATLADRE